MLSIAEILPEDDFLQFQSTKMWLNMPTQKISDWEFTMLGWTSFIFACN